MIQDRNESEYFFFLSPRSNRHEGLDSLSLDLAGFFASIAKLGRDEALLLLTLRALWQRSTSALRVDDLVWILRAPAWTIRRRLDRLVHHRRLIYELVPLRNGDRLVVEFMPVDVSDASPDGTRDQGTGIPTHWFVSALPVVGPASFVTYLALHLAPSDTENSTSSEISRRQLISMAGLSGPIHLRRHLFRLRRHGYLRRHQSRRLLVVHDPPLPAGLLRLRLRLRRIGALPVTWLDWLIVGLYFVPIILFLAILLTPNP